MKKEVLIKIRIDGDEDVFGTLITFKGFDNGKPIQNTIELIGLLEAIKQQELMKLLQKEVGKK